MEKNTKSAFIAIVGRPNVGKSSLLNRFLGQKLAIVSNKPQTTRTRIMGVLTENETQLVFIDTPGLHKPKTHLGSFMVRSINESISGVEACLLVTEAGKEIGKAEEELIEKFKNLGCKAILAINKIDTLKNKEELMLQIAKYSGMFDFSSIVPVSAEDGKGVDALLSELKNLSEESPHFFSNDTLTDQPERALAAEMLREKLLRNLDKEIPHGTAVIIEKMREREDGNILDIDAMIYCERDTHKGIIIGKGGAMLKRINTHARQDMEAFFDCKVNLQVWVKVKEGWRNRDGILKNFGFDERNFN